MQFQNKKGFDQTDIKGPLKTKLETSFGFGFNYRSAEVLSDQIRFGRTKSHYRTGVTKLSKRRK